MDSGILYVIVVIEAIIIVWLMSKLKQYRKFEHLLSSASVPTTSMENQSTESSGNIAPPSSGSTASLSTAENGATSGDDLLDMPGVDPEGNIEEAKRVQLVMARCRYAEFYLEQLDDDYERDQFKRIISSCIATAGSISDPFFKSSALQPLILLLDKAEWHDRRDQLLADVQDDIVRQRITAELN